MGLTLPCWLPARRLRAAPGTFPRLPAGHLHLLPGQVQAPQVQQHLHLPRLGLQHWLAHGPVLHALHPTLGLHQGVEDGGDAAGGEQPGSRGQQGRVRGGGYGQGGAVLGGLVSVGTAMGTSGSPLPHLGNGCDENMPLCVSWGSLASSSLAGIRQYCCAEASGLRRFP